jgi:hypothetical protein
VEPAESLKHMEYPGFIAGTHVGQSVAENAESTENLFPEITSGHGKSKVVLLGTPGTEAFVALPTSPNRGYLAGENRLFAVGGSKFYEVFATNPPTSIELGDVGDDAQHSPVQIVSNSKTNGTAGNQVLIRSAGYVYAAADGIVKQVFFINRDTGMPWDPADPGAVPVRAETLAVLDNYFLAHVPDTNQVNYSELNDGKTWFEENFIAKQGAPDNLSFIAVDHRELWMVGRKTTEVWTDSGNPPPAAPFSRINGVFIEQGSEAPFSPAQVETGETTALMWLQGSERGAGTVVMTNGYSPVRVSDHSLEIEIRRWAETSKITDAVSYPYQEDGHSFYVLHFPTAKATRAYDLTTKEWHKRHWLHNGQKLAHRGRYHAYVTLGGGVARHFVGSYLTGKIYTQSMRLLDDDGDPILRSRTAPHLSFEELEMFYRRFQLDFQPSGTFTLLDASGNERSPEFTLEYSDDGGENWSNARTAYAGRQGKYKNRVIWRQLGSSRNRVFRISCSEKIFHVWINAYLDFTKGTGS